MKIVVQFLMLISFTNTLTAQNQKITCNCPVQGINASRKADKIFTFKDHSSIGLCGSYDKESATYAEFILFRCGKTKVFDEFDAMHPCHLKMEGDTLVVKQEYGLSIGKNFDYIYVPFYIKKYYVKGSFFADTAYFRKDLPKYSAAQITNVLKQYAGAAKQSGDDQVTLANRLFWAYVSGSKQAENYLISFEKKFGPFDGAIAEDFHELWAIYQLYKKQ